MTLRPDEKEYIKMTKITEQDYAQLKERLKMENERDAAKFSKLPQLTKYKVTGKDELIKQLIRKNYVSLIMRSDGEVLVLFHKGYLGELQEDFPSLKFVSQ